MANRKTARKLNRKPQIADIITIEFGRDAKHYMVMAHRLLDRGYHQFYLVELETGKQQWYDFMLWMRRWRKVA